MKKNNIQILILIMKIKGNKSGKQKKTNILVVANMVS